MFMVSPESGNSRSNHFNKLFIRTVIILTPKKFHSFVCGDSVDERRDLCEYVGQFIHRVFLHGSSFCFAGWLVRFDEPVYGWNQIY